MRYTITYTPEASLDFAKIYEHIAFVLGSPINAERQLQRIRKAVDSLDMMPERYPKLHEYTGTENIRVMNVDNFRIIYKVDKTDAIVHITRIVYVRRNLNALFESHAVHDEQVTYSSDGNKPAARKEVISTLKSFEDEDSRMAAWEKSHDDEGI